MNLDIPENLRIQIESVIRDSIDLSVYKVFFFGSRVSGTARSGSDIDIGILGEKSLSFLQMAELRNKLEDIETLHKIDLVDFGMASEDFKTVALANTIPIT